MPVRRWSFLLPFLLFNLFCTGVLVMVLAFFQVPFGLQHIAALGYFLVLGIALQAWQGSAFAADPKLSVQRFMTGMVLKMLLTLLVLLVAIVTLPKTSILAFVLPFIGLYLAHLAFSTGRMYRQLLRAPKP